MPKMKTHKAAAKRFKKTATGKITRKGAKRNHYLRSKSGSQKRRYKRTREVDKSDQGKIKKLLNS